MTGRSRGGPAPRSLLFVPGSRPELLTKVARWGPDAVVLDLEDAVPAHQKEDARVAVVDALARAAVTSTVLVRVNAPGTRWFEADLAAAGASAAQGVVVPKVESLDEIVALRDALPPGAVVVVGLETARGVAECRGLLAGPIDAAYFGAEDYIADIGGRRTLGGEEVLYARSEVALAARLAGVSAIDQAVVTIRDDERFLADAEVGRAIGYAGKICVHPGQVALAHRIFSPSPRDLDHARAVVAAFEAGGVGTVDGQMVDEVHVRMARLILAREEA